MADRVHASAGEPLASIAGFAVVKLHEAVALRDAGIRKPVLLMGPFDTRELADIVGLEIMPMVYTPIGGELDRVAAGVGHPVTLHVCVDTGIGRVGVPFRQARSLMVDLAARRSVSIAGTMMTFTEDPDPALSIVHVIDSNGNDVEKGKARAVPGAQGQRRAEQVVRGHVHDPGPLHERLPGRFAAREFEAL